MGSKLTKMHVSVADARKLAREMVKTLPEGSEEAKRIEAIYKQLQAIGREIYDIWENSEII